MWLLLANLAKPLYILFVHISLARFLSTMDGRRYSLLCCPSHEGNGVMSHTQKMKEKVTVRSVIVKPNKIPMKCMK